MLASTIAIRSKTVLPSRGKSAGNSFGGTFTRLWTATAMLTSAAKDEPATAIENIKRKEAHRAETYYEHFLGNCCQHLDCGGDHAPGSGAESAPDVLTKVSKAPSIWWAVARRRGRGLVDRPLRSLR